MLANGIIKNDISDHFPVFDKSVLVKQQFYLKYLSGHVPKTKYTSYNNKYNSLERLQKLNYFNNLITSHRQNSRAVWQMIKSNLHTSNKISEFPDQSVDD